jgi:hypothetical protein
LIRHCDGGDQLVGDDRATSRFCGRTFDDVERSTICPHKAIGPKLTDGELAELYDAAVVDDRPLDLSKFRPELRERLEAQDDLLRGLRLNVRMNLVEQLVARIRRVIRPPRVVAVTRRPAGWLAVWRDRLEWIVCWGKLEDGQIVGLVAGRRGLRPAGGWRFRGYLPGAALSGRDVQPAPPAVTVPVADLSEAIGNYADPWTPEAMAAIADRLWVAAADEWAVDALLFSEADPTEFLANHCRLIAEHNHAAELDDAWREFLAGLASSNADVRARAEAGRQGGKQ